LFVSHLADASPMAAIILSLVVMAGFALIMGVGAVSVVALVNKTATQLFHSALLSPMAMLRRGHTSHLTPTFPHMTQPIKTLILFL
jgi:hypothetical protein